MPIRITYPDPRQIQRLLPELPIAVLPELAGSARAITYRPGEKVVIADGQTGPGVIAEGTVRLTMRAADGREANLRLIGRGTWVGLTALVEPAPARPSVERTLVAVDRATVIAFDLSMMSRLSREQPAFTLSLLGSLVDWTSVLCESAAQFAFMTVRQRVASHLLRIARPRPGNGTTLVAMTTQQQLADAVGSVREVVSRTLHDMRLEGIVLVARSRVSILDERRLSDSALDVT